MLVSMSKRLGTAQGKSLNQFMKWKVASEQNGEAIAQMYKQVSEAAKKLNRDLTPEEQEKFDELDSIRRQIDLTNIRVQQEKTLRDLSFEELNVMERHTYTTNEHLGHLKQVKDEIRHIVSSEKASNQEKQQAIYLLDIINKSMKKYADAAKRSNPKFDAFYKFSDEIDEMAYKVDDVFVDGFKGAMDQWVSSMWNAEESFHHVMKNMARDIGTMITKMLLLKAIQQGMGMIMGMGGGTTDGAAAMSGMEPMQSPIDFAMANGGILDKYGKVPLRAYSKGGIADSPQLALYGEAGPEAYVPLPDGKTIPVTMQGQQSQPIINVINQTGTQADVESNTRFDGEKYITDVVMKAASRPGKFRNTMRGR